MGDAMFVQPRNLNYGKITVLVKGIRAVLVKFNLDVV